MLNLRFLLTASSFAVLLQPIVVTAQIECDSSNFWMTEDGVCINLDNWQRQTFAEFQQRESARRDWLLDNPFVFEIRMRTVKSELTGQVLPNFGNLQGTIQNRSYEDIYLAWITVAFTQRDQFIGAERIYIRTVIPARDELPFTYEILLPSAASGPYGITPEVISGFY